MSQYTEFYVANAGSNEFVEIGCWGRNSKIAEIFSPYASYEKIKQITEEDIKEIREDCDTEIKKYRKTFEFYGERKHLIAEMNNSVKEKINWIDEANNAQKEILEIIEEIEFVKNFLSFLSIININGAEVYCGIECGKVSREDIA